jgi:hypothetical protein
MFFSPRLITLGLITGSILPFTTSAYAVVLVNPSFEDPTFPSASVNFSATIPGWQTTDTAFEIWTSGFQGVTAYDGNQFAELNAYIAGTLFQEVTGIAAGSQLDFFFSHRARVGTDVMALTITDLGADNTFGTSDDTTLFTKNYSATTAAWVLNTSKSVAPIFALGNNIRFAYSAISTGSGDSSIGNFLDNANFGVGLDIPEEEIPFELETSAGLALLGLLGTFRLVKQAKNRS